MKRIINTPHNRITFINDDSSAPSPNLPVSAELAKIIEHTVNITKLRININSSTGGNHSIRSFHYHGMAVDINLIDGKRVDDISNQTNVRNFQSVLAQHPKIAECFGPFINIRKRGLLVEKKPAMRLTHLNHLHISSQG